MPRPSANARAAAMPTRSPVKGPGPMPAATCVMSDGRMDASASASCDERADDLGVAAGVGALDLRAHDAVGFDHRDGGAERGVDAEDHRSRVSTPTAAG